MSELKPCPFCGESKLLYSGGCGFRYDDDDNQIRLFRVHCRTCKGRTGLFESLDEAVEAWNRRTNSTTIQPSAQPEIIRCKDCKHFEYDHPYIIQGIPVLGHEVCNAWGDGCKTDENGYCFMAERRWRNKHG